MANKQSVELNKLLDDMAKIPSDLDKRFIKILGKIGDLCGSLYKNGGFVREDFGTINSEIEKDQKIIYENCAEKCAEYVKSWKKSDSDKKKAILLEISTKINSLNIFCLEKELGNAFLNVVETLESLSNIYK